MKIIITYLSVFLFILSNNALANNNTSHAIAMHGEPKYEKDFFTLDINKLDDVISEKTKASTHQKKQQ